MQDLLSFVPAGYQPLALGMAIAGVPLLLWLVTRVINLSVIVNPLWWAGVLFLLVKGYEKYAGFTLPLFSEVVLAVGLAIMAAYQSSHTTPIQNKGIVVVAGRRVRILGRWWFKGYLEGLNVPWIPFSTIRDVEVPEFKIDFENPDTYTKGDVPVKVDGYAIFEINDAYESESIEEVRDTAQTLATLVARETADDFTVDELMQAEHRDRLSQAIFKGIREKIKAKGLSGLPSHVRCLVVKRANVVHVDVPDRIKETNSQRYAERAEAELEEVQIERRLEQIDKLKARGIDANRAGAMALVDAQGNKNASVSDVSVSGLDKLGENIAGGLASLGKGLSDLATRNRRRP